MGTEYSVSILKKVLKDESVLYENDIQCLTPLSQCVLTNDCKALEYILQWSIDTDKMIDHSHSFSDFIFTFGSDVLQHTFLQRHQKIEEIRSTIINQSMFGNVYVCKDLWNCIADFTLGTVPNVSKQEIKQITKMENKKQYIILPQMLSQENNNNNDNSHIQSMVFPSQYFNDASSDDEDDEVHSVYSEPTQTPLMLENSFGYLGLNDDTASDEFEIVQHRNSI